MACVGAQKTFFIVNFFFFFCGGGHITNACSLRPRRRTDGKRAYLYFTKGEKTFGRIHFYSSESLASAGGGFPVLRVVAVYLYYIVRLNAAAINQPRVPHNRPADECKSFITAAVASAVPTIDGGYTVTAVTVTALFQGLPRKITD